MCALRGRLRSLPILVLALLFFGLRLPDSPASELAWILATIGALMLGGAITTLLNIVLLWTLAGRAWIDEVDAFHHKYPDTRGIGIIAGRHLLPSNQ